jgi:hypothetical protein
MFFVILGVSSLFHHARAARLVAPKSNATSEGQNYNRKGLYGILTLGGHLYFVTNFHCGKGTLMALAMGSIFYPLLFYPNL